MARSLTTVTCAAIVLAGVIAPVEAMTDPFRPPSALMETAAEAPRAAPVLQSVIITPQQRAAIIDGERVQIGSQFRDSQVVRISENEVVLRRGHQTEVLKMYPDIEKKTVRAGEAGPPTGSASRSRP